MDKIVRAIGIIVAAIGIIFVFTLLIAASELVTNIGTSKYEESSSKENFEESIVSAIEQLNERMPIAFDEDATLTEALIDGKIIILRGTLNRLEYYAVNLDKLQKSQKITKLFYACQSDRVTFWLRSGFNVRNEYYSPSGEFLFSNQISEKDCLPFFDKDKRNLVQYYIELQKDLLPRILDSETAWVDVRHSNNSIERIFQFTNYSKEELDINAVEKFVNTNSPSTNCVAPDAKVFFRRGLSVKDIYVDKNNKTVYSFETTKDMC